MNQSVPGLSCPLAPHASHALNAASFSVALQPDTVTRFVNRTRQTRSRQGSPSSGNHNYTFPLISPFGKPDENLFLFSRSISSHV